jgi:hypothetical protein
MERKQCLELFIGYFLLGLQDTNVYFNKNQQTFILNTFLLSGNVAEKMKLLLHVS